VVAASQGLTPEDSEHLSALAAGLQSLARGAGRHFRAGEVRQTIIEMDFAFLFVIAAGRGTCLAVLTSADANVGLIAYEMAMLVRRMGKYLAAEPRFPDHETAAE
jgi:predicted regulator of Ras-like GTPase activity (Roadblock/LC7/MglB family)